jgi:protein involved in polysaccharide export with SLBB domain
MKNRTTTRLKDRILALAVLFGLCSNAFAQQVTPPASSPLSPSTEASSADTDSTTTTTTSAASQQLNEHGSLTAMQIISILQEKPELVPELKQLVADQLQQQGTTVQADSITDEMLFSQISTNSALRASITIWLRARGYVSADDMDRLLARAAYEDDNQQSLPASSQLDKLNLSASDRAQSGLASAIGQQALPDDGTSAARAKGLTPTSARSTSKTENRSQSVTDEPESLHLPTPYNLRSLRDLYTQVPPDSVKLKRFGSEVFTNRDPLTGGGLANRTTPVDLPIGPDYVLGAGDGLTINLWGGISQNFTRVIDREGKVALPEAGSLVVAGLTLQQARSNIEGALKPQYHNAQVDVTIGRLRTVRVYVVGDVQRPGAYDVSSLSTPLNAIYEAGGPTSVGSLRIVRHYRGQQLVREVDLYDFFLRGSRMDDERLQAGDTLLIPPSGPQVAIFGMVKRPAIYELKASATLKDVLDNAGGVTVAAALNHITIDRIDPNKQRETVSLESAAADTPQATLARIASFGVKDGDRVHVAAILPYSERAIYVEGHVTRPGKLAFRDGMQLTDVIHSYQDLLPEPAAKGDIVRLIAPDFHPETIQFDLAEALIGNASITLQPFDTIRILGRYEVDAPQVTIRGEVLRPGSYALSQDMTPRKLVTMAGGYKRDALLTNADLASYTIKNEEKVVTERSEIPIESDVFDHVPLRSGDILTIHQLSGWNDIGASVILEGEVTYPGSYGLKEGERLSSVLRRAGGLRDTAYAAGAVLVRNQVRDLEEKTKVQLINQIESTPASARVAPSLGNAQEQAQLVQAATQQQAQVLQRLKTQPSSGRLVIHISADINSWADTPADIEMHTGDVLTVPKRPGFVLVSGQVYNASAITYVPGKEAGWYLRRAGGTNDVASRKDIFVIRANGSVIGRRSGEWYSSNVLSTRMDPGDVIVVPVRIIGGSLFWKNLLTVAQIASSVAFTAGVAGVL